MKPSLTMVSFPIRDALRHKWSRPLPEIDRQLYDKYSLSAPERHFIESMIKPMGGETPRATLRGKE